MTPQFDPQPTLTLDRSFVQSYASKIPNWGFNGLGYVVYKRTYARVIEDENRTEEWHETIERCINGAQKIGAGYTKEEMERLFDLMFNLKCSFAGRMLWQLGTTTVDRFGLPSLCNCWYVSIVEPEDFCFVFEHLMLGGGVGFSVRREHVHELPKVKKGVTVTHENTKDADFIVPDSRQGWVEALRRFLHAYFVSGKSFTYSTILVRGAGERIKGFGGVASGPGHLITMFNRIAEVLDRRQGKKLRSVDVLDVCNIIGSCVVAGNVRRSAELAIGDPDDYLYLRAKNWATGQIPNWRAMSNNSIDARSYVQISEDVWKDGYTVGKDGYAKGEPYGFVNIKLAQTKGRTKDPECLDDCEGFNPCVEATLRSYEPCVLAEIFLNNIQTQNELNECARLLYKAQKAVLTLPSVSDRTVEVVRENMRIGLGVTGVCQALDKIEWLSPCYEQLKSYDAKWSETRGWNKSIKLTVVKPSGTLSLLGGSTPGIHPGYSRYFIRRVRMASDDPLIALCRELHYKTEYAVNFDGTEDKGTTVIEFPCKFDEQAVLTSTMTAIRQLELVKKMQADWADQAVSVTVYYTPEELEGIKTWLSENYEEYIKSVSFLLHSKHGFNQAPYEEITEDVYKRLIKKVKPLSSLVYSADAANAANGVIEGLECEGGHCPIR